MMPSKKESHIFEPRLILTEVRLCCDGTWDYLQSRVGRKRIRLILAPFFLVASIMLLVIGATWAKVLAPECGQSLSSAEFSLSSVALRRTLGGNSCPGYDWNSQTRPKDRETAGEYKFAYSVPLSPVIAATPTYVGKSNSIDGPIGVALNGIPIYGPSTSGGGDTVESNGKQTSFAFVFLKYLHHLTVDKLFFTFVSLAYNMAFCSETTYDSECQTIFQSRCTIQTTPTMSPTTISRHCILENKLLLYPLCH